MDVELIKSTRLSRVFCVTDGDDQYDLEYDGAGLGYESVRVKGATVAKVGGAMGVVPRIDFRIEDHAAIIRVATPWWARFIPVPKLRSFSLEIDGQILYSEGPPIVKDVKPREYQPCPRCGTTGAMHIAFTWWGGVMGASLLTHVECPQCHSRYNGKTGKSNAWGIAIYNIIGAALAIVLLLILIYWLLPNLPNLLDP